MSITQFSDDAYNKYPNNTNNDHPGTLIGNWFEENQIRQATGEGRTVPQRHLKRRGLFDGDGPEAWPTPVEKDNTFERVHGKRLSSAKFDTCAGDVGNYKCPITGRNLMASDAECLGVRARCEADLAKMRLIAEEQVNSADWRESGQTEMRYFDTENAANYIDDQPENVGSENHQGAPTVSPASLALDRSADVHYSASELISQHTQPPQPHQDTTRNRVDSKRAFGRTNKFTRPNHEELRKGQLWRDEVCNRPGKTLGMPETVSSLIQAKMLDRDNIAVPSLVELKGKLREYLSERDGPCALVLLRSKLDDMSKSAGRKHVTTKDVLDSVPEKARELEGIEDYLKLLCRTKPDMLYPDELIERLRSDLPGDKLIAFYNALESNNIVNRESGIVDVTKLIAIAPNETIHTHLNGMGKANWKDIEILVRDMCGCGDFSLLDRWHDMITS